MENKLLKIIFLFTAIIIGVGTCYAQQIQMYIADNTGIGGQFGAYIGDCCQFSTDVPKNEVGWLGPYSYNVTLSNPNLDSASYFYGMGNHGKCTLYTQGTASYIINDKITKAYFVINPGPSGTPCAITATYSP